MRFFGSNLKRKLWSKVEFVDFGVLNSFYDDDGNQDGFTKISKESSIKLQDATRCQKQAKLPRLGFLVCF